MFDTHCHLNFSSFKKNLAEVIRKAEADGVSCMVVPGTDFKTSQKAVEIAKQFKNVYAAVGIHPHHVYEIDEKGLDIEAELKRLEELLMEDKVVAVGEVGMDKHYYEKTRYDNYQVNDNFIKLQKQLLMRQMKMAVENKKSLILHNRQAIEEFLEVVGDSWDQVLTQRTVFHCAEPDKRLLEFVLEHDIYIGIDGDVTYDQKKQEFVKTIPLGHLVLETDAPFLLPEPLRSKKMYPNAPANLTIILNDISRLKGVDRKELDRITTENGNNLFQINPIPPGTKIHINN
jgi:TatD DNase family protein